MTLVKPLKATRPTRDKVGLISSRPYESYGERERDAMLEFNPFSFLQIVNPGYKYHKRIIGRKRFTLVKNRFQEFKDDKFLIQDKTASFYIQQIVYRNTKTYTGIIARSSCHDYLDGKIKKHEDTIFEKEKTFSEYLQTVKFNADPVLLTYPEDKDINKIIAKYTKERPEYEFATRSRETHKLWIVENKEDVNFIEEAFSKFKSIYIADGHHRCASSALLCKELEIENPDHTGDEEYNYFMSFLISENQLNIHEFNRLVKDLNGLEKDEFLILLDESFRIQNRGERSYKPGKRHHFSMYLDGEYYSLYLRKSLRKFETALDELDAQILYNKILKPILNIHDLKNDNRISYVKGEKKMGYVKSAVDRGEFKVGFGMLPPDIDEIKKIADEGSVMPPKTTYIDPKLRSGVTIYEF